MESVENVQQLKFDSKALENRLFSLTNLVNAKFNKLAGKIHELSHSDVVWLARVEEFFHEHNYLTERQYQVLDQIMRRNCPDVNLSEVG